MKITSRQLRQIIKEELARSGFGRLREGAGTEASIALSSYLQMQDFADDAIQVGDKLDDILSGNLVVKMGDKGQIVTVIQALVHGKLMQALRNKSPFTHAASSEGEAEISSSLQGMETDGDFGPATKKAVIALQKVQKADALKRFNNLAAGSPELPTIDGKVGRQTLTFLIKGLQGSSISGSSEEPDEPSETAQVASRATGNLGMARSGTYSKDDLPLPTPGGRVQTINADTGNLQEGRDLTARLMNRWLK